MATDSNSPTPSPCDWGDIDRYRALTYTSYEAHLHQRATAAATARPNRWARNYEGLLAYEQSVAPMRAAVADLVGYPLEVKRRPLPLGARDLLQDTPAYRAERFLLPVENGPTTYAVLLTPKGEPNGRGLLLHHGYAGTPEQICGLVETPNDPYRRLGLRAVEQGFHVLAVHHPCGYGAPRPDVSRPLPRCADQPAGAGPNRLHRLALLSDTTLLGMDLMSSAAGLDVLAALPGVAADRLGVYGFSHGGRVALFLAALDLRLRATVVSGHFCRRLNRLIGPTRAKARLNWIDESLFLRGETGLAGDADLASLIVPRALAIEAGQEDWSAIFEEVAAEVHTAREPFRRLGFADRFAFCTHPGSHVADGEQALAFLYGQL